MVFKMELIVLGILFLLISRKKNATTSDGLSDANLFLKDVYAWLANKAGGLSNGTAGGDSTAVRAPCQVEKNGIVMNPAPHTSADVQYKTFFNLSAPLGYEPTCDNFASLSVNTANNPIWQAIVNWHFRRGLTFSSNPIIAAYIGLWYWGGWDQRLVTVQAVKDAILNGNSHQSILRDLVSLRKLYFSKLPYSEALIKAWQDRAESFYHNFSKYV